MKKKPVNKKLSVKELEKRTDILMKQIMILQEMVDMVGENFIKYVRFNYCTSSIILFSTYIFKI